MYTAGRKFRIRICPVEYKNFESPKDGAQTQAWEEQFNIFGF